MKEIINEMSNMQRHLDKVIMDAQGITYDDVSVKQYYQAVLDEIGELNHENKASWCWWKKTQAPVNREKLIEELADVWFFILSLANKFDYKIKRKPYNYNGVYCAETHLLREIEYFSFEDCDVDGFISVFDFIYTLTIRYNVDMETLFEAYKNKHETNLKRVEEGY